MASIPAVGSVVQTRESIAKRLIREVLSEDRSEAGWKPVDYRCNAIIQLIYRHSVETIGLEAALDGKHIIESIVFAHIKE